jgi:hypothetical protein
VVSAAVLPQAMIVAGSMLGLWLYVRLGSWRPKSFGRLLGHLGVAVTALAVFHAAIDVDAAGRALVTTVALFAFFLPAVTHAFLAALYLLEHLQRALTTR